MLRSIGGFDENIFLYNEDLDLCVRLRRAGYSTVTVPYITATHYNSSSAPRSVKLHWRKDWNFAWSYLYVLEKHKGRDAMKSRAWKMLRKVAPKSLFYALVFNRKLLVRDFAATHGIISYLLGRAAPHPD